jgi:hypothetical protein
VGVDEQCKMLLFGLGHLHTSHASRQHNQKRQELHKRWAVYSVEAAPRWPELKLSMYRTHRCSRGTVVPPDVTHTIGRPPPPPAQHEQKGVSRHARTSVVRQKDSLPHTHKLGTHNGVWLINYLRCWSCER